MQEDFLYSLMQIKNGNGTNKDNERIKDFCNFIVSQVVESSQYSNELNEEFVSKAIKDAINS